VTGREVLTPGPAVDGAYPTVAAGSGLNRMPSVYETPRPCLPCGKDFVPERQAGRPPKDYCSDTCRRNAHRRQLFALGAIDKAPAAQRPTVVRSKVKADLTIRTQPANGAGRPTFARRMIALRGRRGWSQQDLARRLGVHQNSIAGWEAGKNEPSLHTFVAIASTFDVSLDDLWGAAPVREEAAS
jgi:DNA-binding XRE family transcriptional regulator